MKKTTIRKVFSFIIGIVLLITTSTMSLNNVFAEGETYVPEVNYTSVRTPVKGATWEWDSDGFGRDHADKVLTYNDGPIGGSAWGYFTSDGGFQKMSGLADKTFVAGITYSYVVCLKAAAGYYIDENTVVKVNGNVCRFVPSFSTNGHYSFAYDYPIGDTFTFEFNADGGSGTMSDGTGMEGFEYTLPECTFTAPAGKKFFAWEVDDSGIPQEAGLKYTPTGTGRTITIKALWQDIPYYLVTYHLQGHGVESNYPPVTDILEGTKISAPTAPTADGYEFAGWYEDAACTTPFYHSITSINQDYNLYAKWVEVEGATISGETVNEWTKGSANGMGFLTNVDPSDINRVTVDGNTIDNSQYTVSTGTDGSTKVTLSDSYLESLGAGSHTINLVTDEGNASMTFTIKASNSNDITAGVGDYSYLLLMLMALSALTLVGITTKRQLRNKK